MATLISLWILTSVANQNPSNSVADRDDGKVRIHGTVVLPDGAPAAGASVYLLRSSNGSYSLPTHPEKTMTDHQGNYAFDNMQLGNYQLWAETSELTSLEVKLRGKKISIKQAADAEPSFDLSLHEGCRYSVQVIDKASHKAVANAKVSFGWTDIDREYLTDDNGTVEIAGLAQDAWYFVIKAERYAINYRKLSKQPLGSRTDLVFELEPGMTLFGTVRDDEGKPIPGAEISASETIPSMTPGLGKVITDLEGKFELTSIPGAADLRIIIEAENHIRFYKEITTPIDQPRFNLDLSIERRPYGGDCVVTVTDESGMPLAGATIENMGNSSADVRKAMTNDDGIARLNDLFSSFRGTIASVKASGHIAQEVSLTAGTKVEPGQVNVSMRKGASIRGRLLQPDGQPAAKIRVYYNHGESGRQLGGRVETDSEGRFQIDGLPNPSTFTFYTLAPYAPIRDRPLPVGTDDEIDVVMEFEGVIRVRAVDAGTGTEIPEFNVKVSFSPDRRRGDPSMGISSSLIEPGTNILGEVKEFRLGQLLPGMPFQITVSAKGYKKTVLRRVEASLELESDVLDVELASEDESVFRIVSGRLKDSIGKPVSGAKVQLIVGEDDPKNSKWSDNWTMIETGQIKRAEQCLQFLTTTSDRDGRFKFERVENAKWMEVVHTGGTVANGRHEIVNADVTSKLKDLELVAMLPSSVKVTVNRENNPEAHSVSIDAENWHTGRTAFSSASKNLPDAANDVLFDLLPPGVYQVSLRRKPVYRSNGSFTRENIQSVKITIDENQETQIDF